MVSIYKLQDMMIEQDVHHEYEYTSTDGHKIKAGDFIVTINKEDNFLFDVQHGFVKQVSLSSERVLEMIK